MIAMDGWIIGRKDVQFFGAGSVIKCMQDKGGITHMTKNEPDA
jgi:hypothetical protein